MSKDREYWYVPKRSDLHQAIIFVHGIYEKFNGKSWNASTQDRIGSYLAKNGATNDGRNISPQSVRTLLAGIPQFLGFVKKVDNTTPSKIEVTDVGKRLIEETSKHKNACTFNNLREGHRQGETINYSEFFELQFYKLQLTNPNIISYCSNLSVFPVYCLLKSLEKLNYLDKEELAIYIFRLKDHSEIDFKINEIENFRKLSKSERQALVNNFKKSDIGNKSLVQAPLTSYFFSLCKYLNCFYIDEDKIFLNKNYVPGAYRSFYKNIKPFDYGKEIDLWDDFFTNHEVKSSPIKYEIKNDYSGDVFIIFKRNKRVIYEKILSNREENNENIMFLEIIKDLDNELEVICCETSKVILKKSLIDEKTEISSELDSSDYGGSEIDYKKLIEEHCSSNNYDSHLKRKVKLLNKITGKDLTNDKNLRGGRLEELFYRLIQNDFLKGFLEEEPIWNGNYDDSGLPRPAPGGSIGFGDMVLFIDDLQIIFELTTIKSKSGQEKSEAFSVPHHIQNHAKEHPNKRTIGVYLAPKIHERITEGMKSNSILGDSKLYCFDIERFLDLYDKNKADLKSFFFNLDSIN